MWLYKQAGRCLWMILPFMMILIHWKPLVTKLSILDAVGFKICSAIQSIIQVLGKGASQIRREIRSLWCEDLCIRFLVPEGSQDSSCLRDLYVYVLIWSAHISTPWITFIQIVNLAGGFRYPLYSPLPGEMIQFDYLIFFKKGWNHHLEMVLRHFFWTLIFQFIV